MLMFLQADNISLTALDSLLAYAADRPSLIVGGILVQIAAKAGLAQMFPEGPLQYRTSGLVLLTARNLFLALGGFDPELNDGEYLPELDFALRAASLGARVQTWLDPGTSHSCAVTPFKAAARRRFAARWQPHSGKL